MLGFKSFAQTSRIPLTEKSTVKDSTGAVYPYDRWFAMISKGEYKVLKIKDGNDEYLLIRQEKLTKEGNQKIYGKDSPNFIGKNIKFSKMKDLDGDVYDDQFLRDKIVVLNFWFVRCAPCRKEMPELNNLYKKYKENERVVFLAICLDDETVFSIF